MKTKIAILILAQLLTLSFLQADRSWDLCKERTLRDQTQTVGWCTVEKAEKMMDLIHEVRPERCVEIGVFGGSSIYPTASALREQGFGIVDAIDPWTTETCIEGYDPEDINYQWWSNLNLDEILGYFTKMLKAYDLEPFCRTLRMTGAEAVKHYDDESIDILHIDGNHTEMSALHDAVMYLPKVKHGGYIWFDDVNWNSTNKAVSYMMENCEFFSERSVGNECYLFRKP